MAVHNFHRIDTRKAYTQDISFFYEYRKVSEIFPEINVDCL